MERYHVPTGRAVPGEDGGEAVAAEFARLRPLLHAIAAAADEPRGPLPPDAPSPRRRLAALWAALCTERGDPIPPLIRAALAGCDEGEAAPVRHETGDRLAR
jgi:hypothetical protein